MQIRVQEILNSNPGMELNRGNGIIYNATLSVHLIKPLSSQTIQPKITLYEFSPDVQDFYRGCNNDVTVSLCTRQSFST